MVDFAEIGTGLLQGFQTGSAFQNQRFNQQLALNQQDFQRQQAAAIQRQNQIDNLNSQRDAFLVSVAGLSASDRPGSRDLAKQLIARELPTFTRRYQALGVNGQESFLQSMGIAAVEGNLDAIERAQLEGAADMANALAKFAAVGRVPTDVEALGATNTPLVGPIAGEAEFAQTQAGGAASDRARAEATAIGTTVGGNVGKVLSVPALEAEGVPRGQAMLIAGLASPGKPLGDRLSEAFTVLNKLTDDFSPELVEGVADLLMQADPQLSPALSLVRGNIRQELPERITFVDGSNRGRPSVTILTDEPGARERMAQLFADDFVEPTSSTIVGGPEFADTIRERAVDTEIGQVAGDIAFVRETLDRFINLTSRGVPVGGAKGALTDLFGGIFTQAGLGGVFEFGTGISESELSELGSLRRRTILQTGRMMQVVTQEEGARYTDTERALTDQAQALMTLTASDPQIIGALEMFLAASEGDLTRAMRAGLGLKGIDLTQPGAIDRAERYGQTLGMTPTEIGDVLGSIIIQDNLSVPDLEGLR